MSAKVIVTRKTREIPNVLRREFTRAMKLAVVHLEGEVKKKTPINFGMLRKSIVSHTKFNPLRGEVFATMPGRAYVDYVEFGRKAGKQPPSGTGSSLRLWVRRKLKLSGSALATATFLIARAIGKRGTKPVKMFKNTEEQERNKVMRMFKEAIKRVERKSSDG